MRRRGGANGGLSPPDEGRESSIGLMPKKPSADASFLSRNAVDCLPTGALESQLDEASEVARPLRVKLGIDPTASDIHLGHVVVLQKLREFQDAGHTVVLIIGDFTARVGDPSGQSALRPMLDPEEIDSNAKSFQDQAFKVIDQKRTEVRRNGEWLDMSMEQLLRLVRTVTVARVLERDDFQQRIEAGRPISMLELLYPVLQGYDSVAVEADVELGGTDQKFNLLFGRDVQQAFGQEPQTIMTMPILPGLDGERRMSKSYGNYVGVTESPEEMFGKLMSLPDAAMDTYYELLLGEERDSAAPAVEGKRTLARRLVSRFHDAEATRTAEEHFDRLHKEHLPPDEIEEVRLSPDLVSDGKVHVPALVAEHFGTSRSEARRLLEQGGIRIDGEPLEPDKLDLDLTSLAGAVVQVGKRQFRRILVDA
jgi:tyrosyl-tRNA synthetase